MSIKYRRASLDVEAQKYEPGKGMEDGFEQFSKVVTNGWIVADDLIQVKRPDGSIVCPFIKNRRGLIFIREGDYIIYEESDLRHCCGSDKFNERFHECGEND